MVPYLGDFSEDATVYIPFNTFSSDDPAASVTITNLADADIKVHKDGSTTEITTDGATIAIDFDTVTGNHLITIDTSVDAAYSTGSDYLVRIEGTTVDAATVNAFVGSFSIENRHSAGALRPTTAGRTLDVTATGAAGIDWGNVENASTAVDLSATDIQLADTVTTLTGHTAQTGDTYALANGATGFNAINTDVELILADTGELQTDWANGGRLDLILDARASQTTADAIETDTQDLQTQVGTAGAGLTDVGGMSTAMKAEINAEVLDVLNTDTFAELSDVPAATVSLVTKIGWLYMLARNQIEQTSTTQTLRADDTTTSIGTSSVSDDGTTFTRGEWTDTP